MYVPDFDDRVEEAELAADRTAAAPLTAIRGGQKAELKAATKKPASLPIHPVLGKLHVTVGKDKAYIQFQPDGAGPKRLLVGINQNQANASGSNLSPGQMIYYLMEEAVKRGLDKPNIVAIRDEWIQNGVGPVL
eukprot:2066510-Alexandrium_andersonii.AAC.1